MSDVLIKWDQLLTLQDQLNNIVEELDNAVDRSNDLEEAIGNPYGRGELREKAGEFESQWSLKRKDLSRDVGKIADHVNAVVEEFQKFDTEAATQFENSQSE
ncbi:MAG: hypothetical protein ACTIKK_09125 [Agrococcus casei]|uniref:hypothetical protein n=1 Tax=Agrococcus casei TaxID=343512 RepID=UPI003F8DE8B3